MKRKFVRIAPGFLSMVLGIAYSVISADAEPLKPYVPLAWVVIGIGGILTIFFSVADDIKFKSLFCQKNQLSRFQSIIRESEGKLIDDPDLEEASSNERLNRLNTWGQIGKDLIVMSRTCKGARQQIVDLTSLIGSAMLRHRHGENFIDLGRTAYKRAEYSKRWHKAAMIAYYITLACYSLDRQNEGHKWVDRMKEIYVKQSIRDSSIMKLHPLLLEVEGLRLQDNQDKRVDAKRTFQEALDLAQQPDLARNPEIARMSKNVYSRLGGLAKLERDTDAALHFYSQALDPTSKDIFKQLDIYDNLGQLALLAQDYDQAHQYYDQQLELAKRKLSPVWQFSAHKGLAKALFKKIPSDIEKAYSHAKQALEIVKEHSEDNTSQDKAKEYEIQDIMINIAEKMYEEYCSLLHS